MPTLKRQIGMWSGMDHKEYARLIKKFPKLNQLIDRYVDRYGVDFIIYLKLKAQYSWEQYNKSTWKQQQEKRKEVRDNNARKKSKSNTSDGE